MKNLVLIMVFLIVCESATAEYVTLYNTAGQSIEAEILSVKNNTVNIRRRDGNEFKMFISSLDKKSQTLVIELSEIAEANPVKIADKDLITVFKHKRIDTSNKDSSVWNTKIITTKIEIELRYAGSRKVDDLNLDYCVYYIQETYGKTKDDYKEDVSISGSQSGLSLIPNQVTSILTDSIDLKESKLRSGYRYSDNDTIDRTKDVIVGTWIRIYDGENMIYEYAKPESLMTKKDWGATGSKKKKKK